METKERTSKGERGELMRHSRRRESVAIDDAKARSEQLLADFEQAMATEFAADDERWRVKLARVKALATEINEHIIADVREGGFPAEFAPGLSLSWVSRGENILKERRAELRKVAQTRLAAIERRAIAAIKRQSVEYEGLILTDGLASEAARALLAAMPKIEELMPPLNVADIQEQIPGLPDIAKRYGTESHYLRGGE